MRILLIEDDTVLGAAVRDQIAGDGQSVDWVTRLDAAGAALTGAAYDLVLLDLMLPDGRGIGFLKTLRSLGDARAFIFQTALEPAPHRLRTPLPVSVASFAMPIAPAAKNALISNPKIMAMMTATITMPMF